MLVLELVGSDPCGDQAKCCTRHIKITAAAWSWTTGNLHLEYARVRVAARNAAILAREPDSQCTKSAYGSTIPRVRPVRGQQCNGRIKSNQRCSSCACHAVRMVGSSGRRPPLTYSSLVGSPVLYSIIRRCSKGSSTHTTIGRALTNEQCAQFRAVKHVRTAVLSNDPACAQPWPV